jgi:integrase
LFPVEKQQQDYYNKFLNSLTKSEYTRRTYRIEFNYYLKDIGVTDPNSLITLELLNDVEKARELEDNLISYISYLQNEKQYSYKYVGVRLSAIFYFYTINRITINKTYVCRFINKKGKKKVQKDIAYTHEQIEKIISVCNLRQRVIVLLMASTGMRVGALNSLDLSHIQRVNIENQYLYKITVYEGEDEEYYTICSFECAAAIDEYLSYRKRFGEKLKLDAPLIREEFDRNDLGEARRPRRMAEGSIGETVDSLLIAAGIKQHQHRKEGQSFKTLLQPVQRCHGFRKFTITQMIKAKLDYGVRQFLVGHHNRGLDENYDRTSVEDRLAEYLKAIDLLTISPENRLRKQVAEQERTIQHKLTEKDRQIEEMVRKQEQFEQLIQSLIDSGQLKSSGN